MSRINDIEEIIREIIKTNEKIVTQYDSKLLCSDYGACIKKLKYLKASKKELHSALERSVNEFFNLKQNRLFERFKINSFRLVPSVLGFELKFALPRRVDKSSRQYFCYIYMMEKLTREYDCISKVKNDYFILDITAPLKLDKLLGGE